MPGVAAPRGLVEPPDGASHSRVDILGVVIDDLSVEDAIAALRSAAAERRRRVVFFANAHTLELAARDPGYRHVLDSADLVFGDGTGVRWAARLKGVRLRANLNGTDLVPAFMAAANGDGLAYYLLGATPDVLARTAETMRRRYPGWSLAGTHHGYLDGATTDTVLAEIGAAKPHVLLVAMGNPLQERWIAEHRDRLDVGLAVGVGGLFAYVCGAYRRAPRPARRLGLEWLVVLFTQRHKWRRYIVEAPVFLARVLIDRAAGGRPS